MSRIGMKYRKRRLKPNHYCDVCGKEFFGRYGAKTCSPRCRKKLQRLTNGTERKLPVTDIGSNIRDNAPPLGGERVFVEVKL